MKRNPLHYLSVRTIIKEQWIAILALLISALGFYYQNIHVVRDVKATVLDFRFGDFVREDCGYTADVVFINNGNRPCSIIEVQVGTRFPNSKEFRNAIMTASSLNQSPFSIKPNEVISKHFQIGKKISEEYYKEECGKFGVAEFDVIIRLIDYTGEMYKVQKHISSRKAEPNSGWSLSCPLIIQLIPNTKKEEIYFGGGPIPLFK